jgi:uncharacterized protein (TIGR02145 family)
MRKHSRFLLFVYLVLPFVYFGCKSGSDNEVYEPPTENRTPDNTTTDTDVIPTDPVTDIDGNVYLTVAIGNQVWMAKNLQVTKFRDGTSIANITSDEEWSELTTPAFRYGNFGLLYNGYTIANGELCPEGWHLPTDAEWAALIATVGGKDVAGGKLKESGTTNWSAPNVGATNEYRFTALPGGLFFIDGSFKNLGLVGYWWSASEGTPDELTSVAMTNDKEGIDAGGGSLPKLGLSCRCVKD